LPNPAGAITLRMAGPAAPRARTASAWSAPRPGRFSGNGLLDEGRLYGLDGSGGEIVEEVENPFLEEEMVDGGVPGRGAAGAVGQGNGVLGVDERLGQVFDGLDGQPSGAEGRDVLDDVSFVESGPVGTQPLFRFDEGIDDVVPLQPGPELRDGSSADGGFRSRAEKLAPESFAPRYGPSASAACSWVQPRSSRALATL